MVYLCLHLYAAFNGLEHQDALNDGAEVKPWVIVDQSERAGIEKRLREATGAGGGYCGSAFL
ncbi:hypothetical protein PILCRDRAFT_816314 [Piloderma croceum F 1598]|uniref:Uncharacterized protein n=1 Tax=Piloderma croceum (strain F 1598) TaxID=765440 RepID=A0A0C3BJ72_PILCF|nr:hypothetical protein PILCRDRAFT_816314 [Piloderma croceum F 1598]